MSTKYLYGSMSTNKVLRTNCSISSSKETGDQSSAKHLLTNIFHFYKKEHWAAHSNIKETQVTCVYFLKNNL